MRENHNQRVMCAAKALAPESPRQGVVILAGLTSDEVRSAIEIAIGRLRDVERAALAAQKDVRHG